MKVTIKAMSTEAIIRVNNEMDSSRWYDSLMACEGTSEYDVTLNPNTMIKAYCGMEGDDEILLDFGGRKEFVKEFEFYRVVIE